MSQTTEQPDSNDETRLPRGAVPKRYEIRIDPDLRGGRFQGRQAVELELVEPLRELVCNSLDLDVRDAILEIGGQSYPLALTEELEAERLRMELPSTVGPGQARLSLSFTGRMNQKLAGFYLSRFATPEGQDRLLGVTQFEATDARRAFPCWDEPDRKAVFSISLSVDEGEVAVSNAPEVAREQLPGGRTLVHFADTMPMSTYLVAFVVGPMELTSPLDVGGVPLRVVHVPGKADLTRFALEVGEHALGFFSEYFGIPYPGEKLDLIAIPDFAFGAMENLGAVTFRESVLLVDPSTASRQELERVADVISHEIAHMWFGDLVTMAWWNGTWLNEAFATFMEMSCVAHFRPEWQRWVSFGQDRASALSTDGLSSTRAIEYPVRVPSDAEGMFDILTYEKGAAVLRMLEQYLGEETFQAGIRLYLGEHRYANATTRDLWRSLEQVSGEPVAHMMDGWILQGGHPMLRVTPAGNGVRIDQEPFTYSPGEDKGAIGDSWQVPVVLRGATGTTAVSSRVLLGASGAQVDLGASPRWVMANAGGTGVYRSHYDPTLLSALVGELASLEPAERASAAADQWAMVLSGRGSLREYLLLAKALGREDEPTVFQPIFGALDLVEHLCTADLEDELAGACRALLRPALDNLGMAAQVGEPERRGGLRGALLQVLGTTGQDAGVISWARELCQADMDGKGSPPGDLARAVLTVAASQGNASDYDRFLERWRSPRDPQEELRYLYALASFRQPELLERTLSLSMSEVRSQNVSFLLRVCLADSRSGATTWAFIERNWDDILGKIPTNTVRAMVGGLSAHCDEELAANARSFLESHQVPSAGRQIAQTMELLGVNVAFAAREEGSLADTLASVSA